MKVRNIYTRRGGWIVYMKIYLFFLNLFHNLKWQAQILIQVRGWIKLESNFRVCCPTECKSRSKSRETQYILVPINPRVVQSPCSTRTFYYNQSYYNCLSQLLTAQSNLERDFLLKHTVKDFLLNLTRKRFPYLNPRFKTSCSSTYAKDLFAQSNQKETSLLKSSIQDFLLKHLCKRLLCSI